MACFFQAEDGIRDIGVTGVQTCALPILAVSLSGPEVRPHVLWQAGGLARLRGKAARAEELTTEADRKSVVLGKSVDLGGRRIIKKKNEPYLSRYNHYQIT